MRRLALVLTGVLITAMTADAARARQTVNVHYTGWLYNHGAKGARFDSSRDRGKPFSF